MLTGLLKALDTGGMERIHRGALAVLKRTGLRIRGRFLLEALADAGCRVDFGEHRAWFKSDLVEKQIAAQRGRYRMVRSSSWSRLCLRAKSAYGPMSSPNAVSWRPSSLSARR